MQRGSSRPSLTRQPRQGPTARGDGGVDGLVQRCVGGRYLDGGVRSHPLAAQAGQPREGPVRTGNSRQRTPSGAPATIPIARASSARTARQANRQFQSHSSALRGQHAAGSTPRSANYGRPSSMLTLASTAVANGGYAQQSQQGCNDLRSLSAAGQVRALRSSR